MTARPVVEPVKLSAAQHNFRNPPKSRHQSTVRFVRRRATSRRGVINASHSGLLDGQLKRARLVNNFVRALLFVQLLLVLRAEFSFTEIDYHLVDDASELEGYVIVLTYGRSSIFTDVERFVC